MIGFPSGPQALKDTVSSMGISPQALALFLLGEHVFILPGIEGSQIARSTCSQISWGGLGEYFDTQQGDQLRLLIDKFSVQILYLLGLHPVLRIYGGLPLWLRWSRVRLQCRRPGFNPGSGRSPGVGCGNPLQYFAWRIPWTKKPGGLQSMGLHR